MSEEIDGEHREQEPAAHQDGSGGEPPRPPRPPTDHNAADFDKSAEPPNWVEKGTLIVLVFTFIAALAAAFEADRLARDTEDALADARFAARITHNDAVNSENLTADALGQAVAASNGSHYDNTQALEAARKANGASQALTRESNGTNKEALTAVQRAFIVVDQLGSQAVNFPGANGKVIQEQLFFPVVQNSGNTPAIISKAFFITPNTESEFSIPTSVQARQMAARIAWLVGAPQDPMDIMAANESNAPEGFAKNIVLGPKGVMQPTLSAGADMLTSQAGVEAQSNRIGRFFYGVINYMDVFNARHVEKYCFRIDGALVIGVGQATTPSRCTHWNCADDQCKEDKASYIADVDVARKKAAEQDEMIRRYSKPPLPRPVPPPN